MFSLLNPAALLALIGLLVPVAIHLWNRRPGREVAVGSLRWLAAGANRRLRNLKPEQLWLLLLRAALLAVLALAVAEPVWRQWQAPSRGQVLLSPEVLGTPAFATLRPAIDSLRRRGYVVRWLAAGFARAPRAAWRADSAGGSVGSTAGAKGGLESAAFTWARVQQATEVFPGQPLYVVTSAALGNFQGSHAALPPGVTWQALPMAGTKIWLQAAALRADSLRLVLGRSTELQTTFRLVSVAQPQLGAIVRVSGLPPLRFERRADKTQLTQVKPVNGTPTDTGRAISVRNRPLRVIVYSTAAYAADAHYLQAGLRAAATGLPLPLALTTTTRVPVPATRPDWLFWLSEAAVPAAWQTAVNQGTNIWLEAAGPGAADTASFATDAAEAATVMVFRRNAVASLQTTVPLWADGRGRALLTRKASGQGAVYQLHTRLNPTWSELADDPQLPAHLLNLLQPESPFDPALAAHDQRAIDPTQLAVARPTLPPATVPGPAATFRRTDLRPWLVLAAGLLFLLERLLARRREARTLTLTTAS
jgi:hypothetical protein